MDSWKPIQVNQFMLRRKQLFLHGKSIIIDSVVNWKGM